MVTKKGRTEINTKMKFSIGSTYFSAVFFLGDCQQLCAFASSPKRNRPNFIWRRRRRRLRHMRAFLSGKSAGIVTQSVTAHSQAERRRRKSGSGSSAFPPSKRARFLSSASERPSSPSLRRSFHFCHEEQKTRVDRVSNLAARRRGRERGKRR